MAGVMAPRTIVLSAPDPVAGHCRATPLLETPGPSQASLAHLLWVLVYPMFCLCPPRVGFPSLWKFCNQIPLTFKFPGDS